MKTPVSIGKIAAMTDKEKATLIHVPAGQPKRADTFVSTYVNNVKIGVSKWDIALTVGYLDEVGDGTVHPLQFAHLHMTPAFARALATDLMRVTEQYENNIGDIVMPRGTVLPQSSQKK